MKFQGRSPIFQDFSRTNSFSRTFQGKPKIQGLFKDCGNPEALSNDLSKTLGLTFMLKIVFMALRKNLKMTCKFPITWFKLWNTRLLFRYFPLCSHPLAWYKEPAAGLLFWCGGSGQHSVPSVWETVYGLTCATCHVRFTVSTTACFKLISWSRKLFWMTYGLWLREKFQHEYWFIDCKEILAYEMVLSVCRLCVWRQHFG